MTAPNDSTFFDSYLPVYDAIPESWDDAKPFIVEALKKISNSVNVKEIGFFLDEEVLSGKAFIPGVTIPGNNPGIFRSILRKVIDMGPIVVGINLFPHGILFDVNFTLIQLWVSATNSTTFKATTFSNEDTLTMDATNINVISTGVYNRSFAFVEYIQEL